MARTILLHPATGDPTNILTAYNGLIDGGNANFVELYNGARLAQTLVDAGTVTWDASLGGVAALTLGGNRTVGAINLPAGILALSVIQDGTGSRTVTWNALFKWPAGAAPALSTGAGKRDVFLFLSDGTNLYAIAASFDVR